MVERDQLIAMMREKVYKPLTEAELVETLGLSGKDAEQLRELILTLEREGVIIRTRYGRLGLPEKMNLVVGRLQGNERGYAFLISPNRSQDVYIAASSLSGAMHGDRVIARLLPRSEGKREEGEVIRILDRANQRIVGRFEGGEHVGFCRPDERRIGQDIVISPGATQGAQTGDRIVVRITQFPDGRRQVATGVVEEVLGRIGDPGVDVLAVMRQYDLPDEFPDEVKREVAKMKLEVGPEDIAGRLDLRDWPTITIDGADAKDLDDAISVVKLANGNYQLGVHIADVGHYVRAGSEVDKEAFRRGNSVYLLDRVLPMLPFDLSNGICSLTAGVDRLTLSVIMEIDANGNLVKHEIAESVINSHARMTYDEVNRLLEGGDAELEAKYHDLLEQLHLMRELHDILAEKRSGRGAIDFEVQEAQIILDEEGRVQDIVPRIPTLADSIIEEFMVRANETVAETYYWLELPFIYRVHEEPKSAKISELNNFLGAFGLRIKAKPDHIHPKSFQSVLAQVEGRPEQRLIHRVLLRSMMRARYSPDCLGHFGLALKYYCHFTAPIRRYSDLVIHRIIKENLRKRHMSDERRAHLAAFVERAATQASAREQVATEAERMVVDIKKTEFMLGKEGEIYDAIISGVTNFGFFAELDNTVEGLVHVSSLDDDYYEYDEETYSLIGKQTKRRFRLGDRVRVQVVNVDLEERRIDFELAPNDE
ncbi:MAG: ribonuclease R [Firmicutes bacterium]|nr:ribonuclease R [Bacillota bacterium]